MHSSALFTDAGGGNTDAVLYMFGTLYTEQMEVLFFIPFVNARLHNNNNNSMLTAGTVRMMTNIMDLHR